jgi:type IV pilus assembly protein PilM
MGLSLFNSSSKRPDHMLAVDLGGCQTKAIEVQRKGGAWHLVNYALIDAPPQDKARDLEVLTQHFKAILEALGNPKIKNLTVALGVDEAVVRQIELPMMAPEDVRQMLKINSKNYLQLDLPDHVFDCLYLPPRRNATEASEPGKPTSSASQKFKVLVTGCPRRVVDGIQNAAKAAGLVADGILPSVIGLPNAFESVEPDVFNKEIVGLVDIGFKHSTIVVLDAGEILLNRVVNIGSERLTLGLAEAMGISPSEAEGIKIGMAAEVAQSLEAVINPLGRELRASLDFFENQQDKTISQVFLSGGAARNEVIVQSLQNELMVPCRNWSPLRSFQSTLSPEKQADVDQFAPQLSVAIGSAVSSF